MTRLDKLWDAIHAYARHVAAHPGDDRADRAFFVRRINQQIELLRSSSNYRVCPDCHGNLSFPCSDCRGGHPDCETCHGEDKEDCKCCGGNGVIRRPE